MPDLLELAEDVALFGQVAGRPLKPWQAESLRLGKRTTAIVAPRQSGKSYSLSVLAPWWAFTRPGSLVLIVSAGEEAARRLLAEVRAVVTGSPLLAQSVVDDQAQLVRLTNGSEIRSVPASERQVRGWSVDLLLIDEAALVPDDLLVSAALPTTAARPQARVVMASSALSTSGSFYDNIMLGRQGHEHIEAFHWALKHATWISPSVIAAAKATMSPTRYAAEFEGIFSGAADALFSKHLLDRVTANVEVPGFDGLSRVRGLQGGVDWGATTDRSTVVALAPLLLPRGVFVVAVAHAWPSGHQLSGAPTAVVDQIVDRAGAFSTLVSEGNGLGWPLSEELKRRIYARWRGQAPEVRVIHTSAGSKAAGYSALRMAMEYGRLVLPASAVELRRELALLRVELLASGGERIEAGAGQHDDLADGLCAATVPYQRSKGWSTRLADAAASLPAPVSPGDGLDPAEWAMTGGGLAVPCRPLLMPTAARRPGSTANHPWT